MQRKCKVCSHRAFFVSVVWPSEVSTFSSNPLSLRVIVIKRIEMGSELEAVLAFRPACN